MAFTFILAAFLVEALFASAFADFGQCSSCGGVDFGVEDAASNLDWANANLYEEYYARNKRDLLEKLPEEELLTLLNAIRKSNAEQNKAISQLVSAKDLAKEFGIETEGNNILGDKLTIVKSDMNTAATETENETANSAINEETTTNPTPNNYEFIYQDSKTENPTTTATTYNDYQPASEPTTVASESEKAATVEANVVPAMEGVDFYQMFPQVQVIPEVQMCPQQQVVMQPMQFQPQPQFYVESTRPTYLQEPKVDDKEIEFSTSDVIIEQGKSPVIKSHHCKLHSSHVVNDSPQKPTHYIFL